MILFNDGAHYLQLAGSQQTLFCSAHKRKLLVKLGNGYILQA